MPLDILVQEAEKLAEKGVKELILIAQDLTFYGYDMDGKSHIVELVERLCAIEKYNGYVCITVILSVFLMSCWN